MKSMIKDTTYTQDQRVRVVTYADDFHVVQHYVADGQGTYLDVPGAFHLDRASALAHMVDVSNDVDYFYGGR